jgi:hypothetical protein
LRVNYSLAGNARPLRPNCERHAPPARDVMPEPYGAGFQADHAGQKFMDGKLLGV